MLKAILPHAETAVVYLRMSDERQEHSIEAQRSELTSYAAKNGYRIVGEYLDEAISGDDTGRRTAFLQMRDDATKGDFAVVLCWDQDRFGRFDPIEGGFWILPFRNAGVRLETVAQGKIDWCDFAGRLIYLVQQEGKHAYLRDLSRNVARGQLNAAKNGRGGTGGRAPAGYKHVGDEVVVDPVWAAIIRRIFAAYLTATGSVRSVVSELNREGILTPHGKRWTTTSIHGILTNRKYTGDFVRFRYQVGKYHSIGDGEIVSRQKTDRRTEPKPMVVENRFEAIIDRRTFDQVQRKLAGQRKHTAHRTGHQYVFSGMIRCGDCGGAMGGIAASSGNSKKTYRTYKCRTFQSQGSSACHCNSISEAKLLAVVVRKLQETIFAETSIEGLLDAYRDRLAARRQGKPNADEGRLRKQIDSLDQQIDQGAERVLAAPKKLVSAIFAKLEKLREERDRLQARLDAVGKPETTTASTDAAKVEEARRVLRDMAEAFADAEPTEIRNLLTPLISKIELQFKHLDAGGKKRNLFQAGTIFVRPSDPALSLMLGIAGC